jgi:hypothetical protein
MNEEIEYAEMLEIPVSTVNVVRKKHRARNRADLKDKLISRVNERVEAGKDKSERATDNAPTLSAAEPQADEERAEGGERIDTVLLNGQKENTPYVMPQADEGGFFENEGGRVATNAYSRREKIALTTEFILACGLCGAIFLTNVFMPTSAINTFFRSLSSSAQTAETKAYTDIALTSVVSELANAEMSLSAAGVLSFTVEGCVYPIADGTVLAVTNNADGTFDVKISHTDDFYGIIGGLDYVYYVTGDNVAGNVPVGYSKGENAVRVTLYSGEELLTCYALDENNGLSWVTTD